MKHPASITWRAIVIRGAMRALLLLPLLLAPRLWAQDSGFSMDFVTVGAGVVTGTSEEFSMEASVGQWDAGSATNDEFSTAGGFWSIAAVLQPPIIQIIAAGSGQVLLFWTPAPDFVLQESTSLSPANWTNSPSGGTNTVNVSISENTKFYRLAKP